jgi:hypothetical protein
MRKKSFVVKTYLNVTAAAATIVLFTVQLLRENDLLYQCHSCSDMPKQKSI